MSALQEKLRKANPGMELATVSQLPAMVSEEKVDLVKRTIARGATDDELELFVAICNRTGLDPFARQIYAVKRWDNREKREVMAVQTSIDGFRLIADRGCRKQGWVRSEDPTVWCGPDGIWKEEWLLPTGPTAARYTVVIVSDRGEARFSAVARFAAYAQHKSGGDLNPMWSNLGEVMIAKCAEALALRKAFPQELSGLYTEDELDHSGEATIVDMVAAAEPAPDPSARRGRVPRPAPGAATVEAFDELDTLVGQLSSEDRESFARWYRDEQGDAPLPPGGIAKRTLLEPQAEHVRGQLLWFLAPSADGDDEGQAEVVEAEVVDPADDPQRPM